MTKLGSTGFSFIASPKTKLIPRNTCLQTVIFNRFLPKLKIIKLAIHKNFLPRESILISYLELFSNSERASQCCSLLFLTQKQNIRHSSSTNIIFLF